MDPKPHSWTCPKCGSLRIQPAINSTGTLGLTCGQCTHVWWEWPLDHESRKPKVEPSRIVYMSAGGLTDSQGNPYPEPCENDPPKTFKYDDGGESGQNHWVSFIAVAALVTALIAFFRP